jgi:hypothetical protein
MKKNARQARAEEQHNATKTNRKLDHEGLRQMLRACFFCKYSKPKARIKTKATKAENARQARANEKRIKKKTRARRAPRNSTTQRKQATS